MLYNIIISLIYLSLWSFVVIYDFKKKKRFKREIDYNSYNGNNGLFTKAIQVTVITKYY